MRAQRRGIQVAVDDQVAAALAGVSHGEHVVVEELALQAEVEVVISAES